MKPPINIEERIERIVGRLWRMKKPTQRAKDAADLLFLAELFKADGQLPPEV